MKRAANIQTSDRQEREKQELPVLLSVKNKQQVAATSQLGQDYELTCNFVLPPPASALVALPTRDDCNANIYDEGEGDAKQADPCHWEIRAVPLHLHLQSHLDSNAWLVCFG